MGLARKLLKDVLLVHVLLGEILLPVQLILGLYKELACVQELLLTSRQLRTPNAHDLVELLRRYDLELGAVLTIQLHLLIKHPILNGNLVLQELDLLVPLLQHGLIHLDYLLLRKSEHILLVQNA